MVELHVVAVATQVRFLGGALFYIIRVVSSVVRIPAFQAGGPGSIPGRRTILHYSLVMIGHDHRELVMASHDLDMTIED